MATQNVALSGLQMILAVVFLKQLIFENPLVFLIIISLQNSMLLIMFLYYFGFWKIYVIS